MADAPHKSRILIADDNGPNVELLEAYLSDVDCEIEVAVDGRDTLAKVASFEPDLILLDVMMPKLSGFEVCEQLKVDPAPPSPASSAAETSRRTPRQSTRSSDSRRRSPGRPRARGLP